MPRALAAGRAQLSPTEPAPHGHASATAAALNGVNAAHDISRDPLGSAIDMANGHGHSGQAMHDIMNAITPGKRPRL